MVSAGLVPGTLLMESVYWIEVYMRADDYIQSRIVNGSDSRS